MTKVLFVNSGILGMASFSKFIREAMVDDPEIDASHIDLSEDMKLDERIIRPVLCARLWPDGLLGLKNPDLERRRSDYHAGLQASRRIRRTLANGGVDVIHFHRQGTAYASLPLTRGVRIRHAVAAYSPGWLDVWKSADAFVLPTRQDAFATVFQEAAAAGLPRIGTRVNTVPETIRDGENGLLVSVGNHAELVHALRRLIGSAALRRQLGTAGRRAIEGFGPDAYLSKLREVVQSNAPRSR